MKRICTYLSICIVILLFITGCNNSGNSFSKTTQEVESTVGTDLFKQIYIPYAKGENRTGISNVKTSLMAMAVNTPVLIQHLNLSEKLLCQTVKMGIMFTLHF